MIISTYFAFCEYNNDKEVKQMMQSIVFLNYTKYKRYNVEEPGIDPGTSRMLSERSTT